jgi:hypothetical protein
MATRVRFSIPEREIENTGITFRRDVDDVRHGGANSSSEPP